MHLLAHFTELTYTVKCMVPAFETPRAWWCDCTECQSMAETMVSMDRVFEDLLGYKRREDASIAFWDDSQGEVWPRCPRYIAEEVMKMAKQVQKERSSAISSRIQEEPIMFETAVCLVTMVEIPSEIPTPAESPMPAIGSEISQLSAKSSEEQSTPEQTNHPPENIETRCKYQRCLRQADLQCCICQDPVCLQHRSPHPGNIQERTGKKGFSESVSCPRCRKTIIKLRKEPHCMPFCEERRFVGRRLASGRRKRPKEDRLPVHPAIYWPSWDQTRNRTSRRYKAQQLKRLRGVPSWTSA